MRPIVVVVFVAALAVAASARVQTPAPNQAQAAYQLGRDAVARGEPAKAVEHFEKAVTLKPDSADYHYQLGNAYGQAVAAAGLFGGMSMAKKAKAEWERAVQLNPNLIAARFALLEFDLQAPAIVGGSTAAATDQATEIRQRDAIDGHRAFASIHAAAKKPDLVRKEYTDMLKELPESARAHYCVGVYQMLTEKNYTSARDEFESVVKLAPAYMPGYFQIGHVAVLASTNLARGEETIKNTSHIDRQTRSRRPRAPTIGSGASTRSKAGLPMRRRSTPRR